MKLKACIIIEHNVGIIAECSFELASLAASSPIKEHFEWFALMAGSNIEQEASRFATSTGIDVVALSSPPLKYYSGEGYLRAISSIIDENQPALVCASHTSTGCDFAPAIAMHFKMEFISGVQNITARDGMPLFRRERMNGKIIEEITPQFPAVCTVMPGALFDFSSSRTAGKVILRTIDMEGIGTKASGFIVSQHGGATLSEAEVVVSAGRGVGTKENMKLINDLASQFARSAIGGSRAACDMGLVDYGFQIGMTGRKVSPRLYIACGISGSAQHIAGMKHSRAIIAINRDEHAPIFQVADVGVVDEIEKFLPKFLEMDGKNSSH